MSGTGQLKKNYNRFMLGQHLDYKGKFICQFAFHSSKLAALHKIKASSTFPDNPEQCLIFIPDQPISIYTPIYQQFKQIVGSHISLASPSLHLIIFMRNIFTILKQYYKSQQIIIYNVFGSLQPQFLQFYNKHIIRLQQMSQFQISQEYKQNQRKQSQTIQKKCYGKMSAKQMLQHDLSIESRLKSIPLQKGNSRLQPMIKLIRQLKGMFGFQLVYPNLDQRDGAALNNQQSNNIVLKMGKTVNRKGKKVRYQNCLQAYHLLSNLLSSKNIQKRFDYIQCIFGNLIEQLIEYQFLVGKPYPLLNLCNVLCYYNLSQNLDLTKCAFILNPFPIIIQSLGLSGLSDATNKNVQKQYTHSDKINSIAGLESFKCNFFSLIQMINQIQNARGKLNSSLQISKINSIEEYQKFMNKNIKQIQKWIQIKQNREGISCKRILSVRAKNGKLASMYQIEQSLHLNSHISDLSQTRHEYVLKIKLQIIQYLLSIVGEKQQQLQKMSKFCQILLCLIGLQFNDILRDEDFKMKQSLKNNLQFFLQQQYFIRLCSSIQRLALKLKNQNNTTYTKLCSLPHQIKYHLNKMFCSNTQSTNKNQLYLNYEIQQQLILKFLIFQISSAAKNKQKHNKKASSKQSSLQHIDKICSLLLKTIYILDNDNIFWCEHMVFRKIMNLMKKQKQTKIGIKLLVIEEQLQSKLQYKYPIQEDNY